MTEAGHVRVGTVGPRPLGLVKSETVHFVSGESRVEQGLQSRGGISSQKSMRNLQETLRQAALFNIVAAVNRDDVRTAGGGTKVGGDYQSGTFSRHLVGAPPVPPNTASSVLGHRSRTISIPRPPRAFMDTRQQLAAMPAFMPPSTAADDSGTAKYVDTQLAEKPNGYTLHGVAVESSVTQGESVDNKDAGKSDTAGQTGQVVQLNQTPGRQTSRDDKRAQTVQQMQALRRHISTSRKKELFLRLTEMAKCEAVDISEPVGAPSIIILAQKRSDVNNNGAHPVVQPIAQPSSAAGLTTTTAQFHPGPPANTRVQSESAEAMSAYRVSRGMNDIDLGDNLRIESLSAGHGPDSGLDYLYKKETRRSVLDGYQSNVVDLNTWVREHIFSDAIVGKTVQSPELMELRPVDALSPSPAERSFIPDKKRFLASRRMPAPVMREKLFSPSPAVYEASFHRPKASTGDMSLVGQSLPTLASAKSSLHVARSGSRRAETASKTDNQIDDEAVDQSESHLKQLADLPERRSSVTTNKAWGNSFSRQTPAPSGPRPEIIEHLQCRAIIDPRPPPQMLQSKSISRISGINKIGLQNNEDTGEEFDRCSEPAIRTSLPEYRRSKLYSAFRASEENLAGAGGDAASMVSETLTTRSLLGQTTADKTAPPVEPEPEPAKPLYMGCSSMASDAEPRRPQFHYVNGEENTASFKVLKALDQDVYFDFQHRKYRGGQASNQTTPLNTAPNKPKMHFLKIKFPGET